MMNNTINAEVTMGGVADTLLAGRYRVVRPLGQDGMSSVWFAERGRGPVIDIIHQI